MKPPEFNEDNESFSPEKSEASENVNTRKFENLPLVEKTPDELRRISEIRDTLQESISSELPEKEDMVDNSNKQKTVVVGDRRIVIEYVAKEAIYPAFGYGGGNKAVIREDLSPRIKRFVTAHEVYHCIDKARWGGWVGREIRANIIPGLKDPVGLMTTIWATVSNIDRIKLYLKRIKGKY
jgi:hypothetical protein